MKILLLEDEYLLSRSIRTYLLANNYFVDDFDNGADALECIKKEKHDFYILDINTPVIGGLDVLRAVESLYPETPKIIISAYHDINYISEAFELGCGDYLKKPFNLKELQIRIEQQSKKIADPKSENSIILSQRYTFAKDTNMLYYDNQIEKFSKREYALILLFVSNLGKILSEENIRSVVWEDEETEASTVRSLVNRLRNKLKEELIENIRGFGYVMKKAPSASNAT